MGSVSGPLFALLLVSQAVLAVSQCNNQTHHDCQVGTKRRCIPLEWLCDNVPDCENASDELNCHYLHDCAPGTMMCRDGACISKAFKCDGEVDCEGGHDEHGCEGTDLSHLRSSSPIHVSDIEPEAPEFFRTRFLFDWHEECAAPKFRCQSGGQCIVETAVCDGEADCPDGDDEKNCTTASSPARLSMCLGHQMQCHDGNGCLPRAWVCDGEADCDDGSDENDCSHFIDPLGVMDMQSNDILCSYNEFRCEGSIGLCIPSNKTCDGVRDCPRGEDEDDRCRSCQDLGCHHKCHLTENGGQCYCEEGFRLGADERSCEDVDECQTHEGKQCQHFCDNHHQKYVCRCAAGYSLGRDGHSCHVDKNHEGILFVSLGSEVRSMPLFDVVHSDSAYNVAQDIASHGMVRNIDYMHRNEELYMAMTTGPSDGELVVSKHGKMFTLRENFVGIAQVAVDWIGGNVYVTQKYPAARPGISVCTSNGFFCRLIVEGNQHSEEDASKRQTYRGLALNPMHGTMAWIEGFGGKHRIMSANMDGTNVQMLADNKLEEPNGLVFDGIRNEVYFGDIGREMIEKINLKTMERHIVLTHGVHHPFDLVYFDGLLYWSDWGTETLKVAEISTHHSSSHVVHTFKRFPYGLSVNHTTFQPRPMRDPCELIKDTCHWVCVVVPGVGGQLHPTCVCPDNYSFSAKDNTCIPKENPIPSSQDSFYGVALMEDLCQQDKACANGGKCEPIREGERIVRITCRCPAPFYGDRCETADPFAEPLIDDEAHSAPSATSWSRRIFLLLLLVALVVFIVFYKKSRRVNEFTKTTIHRVAKMDAPQQLAQGGVWIRNKIDNFQTKSPGGTFTRVSHARMDNPSFEGPTVTQSPLSYGTNDASSSRQQSSTFSNPMFSDSDGQSSSTSGYQTSYANKFLE